MKRVCLGPRVQAQERAAIGVGICTGRVYVGRVGDPRRAEISVLGDTVNTAARIMAAAASAHADVPLVAESTRAAAAHVQDRLRGAATLAFAPHGMLKLKGKAELLPVFRVMPVQASTRAGSSPEPQSSPSSSAPASTHTLTVRHSSSDVAACLGAAQAAAEGNVDPGMRIVALLGEAGMGKSHVLRLASEQLRHPSCRHRILFCRATPNSRDQPFFVIGALLSQAIEDGDAKYLKEGRWCGSTLPENTLPLKVDAADDDTFVAVTKLLGSFPGVRDSLMSALRFDISPALQQYDAVALRRLASALLGMSAQRNRPLIDAAHGGALVLVIEDAMWADVASLDVLASLLHAETSVALWLSSRPLADSVSLRSLHSLLSAANVRVLQGLSQIQCSEIILTLFAGARYVDAALVGELLRRTGGSPLFLLQLCELLVRRSVMVLDTRGGEDGAVVIAPALHGYDTTAVPDTVEGVILERLDGLDPRVAEIARAASIEMHGGFLVQDAACLAFGDADTASASAHNDDDALARVPSFFTRLSPGPPVTWGFAHALLQQCVYHAVPVARRRIWHRARAAALKEVVTGDTEGLLPADLPTGLAVRIASHLQGTGDSAAAAALFLRAAEKERRFVDEAAALAARAAAQDADSPLSDRLKARALLVDALFMLGGHHDLMKDAICAAMPLLSMSLELSAAAVGMQWTIPPLPEMLAEPLASVRARIATHAVHALSDARSLVVADPRERECCISRTTVLVGLGRVVYGRTLQRGVADGIMLWACFESLRAGQPHRFGVVGSAYAAQLLEASCAARRIDGVVVSVGFPALAPHEALERHLPSPELCALARAVLSTAALTSDGSGDFGFRIIALRWHFVLATIIPDAIMGNTAEVHIARCEAVAAELCELLNCAGDFDGADDVRSLLAPLQVSWGRFDDARANIDILLSRAREDRRGLRLAIALRSSLLLEATRRSADLEHHLTAYVACQRNDRFPINGLLMRAVAAGASWLRPEAERRLGALSTEDRSSLFTAARACVTVLDQLTKYTIPRIVQSFYIFQYLDIIALFWRRVYESLVSNDGSELLGIALTSALQRALDMLLAIIDPLGPGLAVCLYWAAIAPIVVASTHRGRPLMGCPLGDEPDLVSARVALDRALSVAERRHEQPLAARIRADIAALAITL